MVTGVGKGPSRQEPGDEREPSTLAQAGRGVPASRGQTQPLDMETHRGDEYILPTQSSGKAGDFRKETKPEMRLQATWKSCMCEFPLKRGAQGRWGGSMGQPGTTVLFKNILFLETAKDQHFDLREKLRRNSLSGRLLWTDAVQAWEGSTSSVLAQAPTERTYPGCSDRRRILG